MDTATHVDGPVVDPNGASSPSVLRNGLVDGLKSAGQIGDAGVEAAFRAEPRHVFLPQFPVASVYEDRCPVQDGRPCSEGVVVRRGYSGHVPLMYNLSSAEPSGNRVEER